MLKLCSRYGIKINSEIYWEFEHFAYLPGLPTLDLGQVLRYIIKIL